VDVSIPLVVILGAAVWVAWRYMGLRGWHIAVCLLFGFFLAATSAAPEIRRLVSVLVQSLSQQ
jgi:NhaP-type Na+/H+ or K+/H+ antiporter